MYFERTKGAKLDCLFMPYKKSTKYGLNSITQQSILTWNSICKSVKTDLSKKSRHELKSYLTSHFLSHYDDDNNNSNNIPTTTAIIWITTSTTTILTLTTITIMKTTIAIAMSTTEALEQRARNNNYYGQLRHDVLRPRFQSRWEEGPVYLT